MSDVKHSQTRCSEQITVIDFCTQKMLECLVPSQVYTPCNRLQYGSILVCFKNVLMEQFDWLMVYHKRMVAWSSATGVCGVQCVMMIGTIMMQQWCADSWAIVQLVSARRVFTCELQLRRVHKSTIALCNASFFVYLCNNTCIIHIDIKVLI